MLGKCGPVRLKSWYISAEHCSVPSIYTPTREFPRGLRLQQQLFLITWSLHVQRNVSSTQYNTVTSIFNILKFLWIFRWFCPLLPFRSDYFSDCVNNVALLGASRAVRAGAAHVGGASLLLRRSPQRQPELGRRRRQQRHRQRRALHWLLSVRFRKREVGDDCANSISCNTVLKLNKILLKIYLACTFLKIRITGAKPLE